MCNKRDHSFLRDPDFWANEWHELKVMSIPIGAVVLLLVATIIYKW